MSIQATIATLKALELVDTRIQQLEVVLQEERVNMDGKSERHVALVTKLANLEGAVDAMDGTRNELYGEQRQLNVQVEKSREKMTRCRNEREANAAQRELEELRRLLRERETEIQKLSGFIDDAKSDLARVDGERVEIASQIDETEGAATEKVRTADAALRTHTQQRVDLLNALSPANRSRYVAVSKHRGTGSAAAVGGSCSACHISISPMMYQEIMRLQELHQCASCHRLLYFADAVPHLDDDGAGDFGTASAGEVAPGAED